MAGVPGGRPERALFLACRRSRLACCVPQLACREAVAESPHHFITPSPRLRLSPIPDAPQRDAALLKAFIEMPIPTPESVKLG